MEFVEQARWDNALGIAAAGRAFIERWLELFGATTLDTYRVRHLNLRLAVDELVTVIEEVRDLGTRVINVEDVAAEVRRFLEEDVLSKTLLPEREHYFPTVAKPLTEAKKPHPGLLALAKDARRVLRDYRGVVLNRLPDAIAADDVTLTVHLAEALASDLIGEGYDRRFLYRAGESLFAPPARRFVERLAEFLGGFDKTQPQTFKIFFRVSARNLIEVVTIPDGLPRITFHRTTPAGAQPLPPPFGRSRPLVRYAEIEIEAVDPYAAAREAFAELHAGLDTLQFCIPRLSVRVYPIALVRATSGQETIPLDLPILGPMHNAAELESWLPQLTAIDQRRLAQSTSERLTAGLRYLRRGLLDEAPYGQFLNFWIGLESLAGTDIDMLRDRVSQLTAVGYVRRVLATLLSDTLTLRLRFATPIHQQIFDAGDRISGLVALWSALTDHASREAILAATGNAALFQHRVRRLAASLGTKASTLATIRRHAEDVRWHVQRMYRIRNAIVHGGYIPPDLTHVASHLATYLWATLRTIISELARPDRIDDIDEVFLKYGWLYRHVPRLLEETGPLPHADVIQPTRLWPGA